ncbi:uncharacterized protein LOC116376818 [Anarrhichthys ocellatus]|uniref:uncharacterized protein LOC116376818 n=1 Tax=Anarrhichthys ocellatus TaxID=433405 RepID=UPI0012ED46C6|nr:uncharacterized protein LOC116376818 [Anarrhichthys ocellatus]
MEKLTGLCVLLVALSLAVTEDKFFTENGSLTLEVSASNPEPIKNILWKFDGHLLAEWIKDKVPVEFYRSFKGRSTLNTQNGRLVVNSMSGNDTGVYSVEINSNVQSVSYTAKWIRIVPKPEAVLKPLTCTSSKACYVSCDGDTEDVGPVTYSWKMGAKDWELLGKRIEITDIKNAYDKDFTCRMANPLSANVSEPITNPFYQEHKPDGPQSALWIVIVLLLIILAGVGVGLWKFKKFPFQNRCSHRTDTEVQPTVKPTCQPEILPLNPEQPT